MEKKYPVLKCDEELWNEIKPVLKSFGINVFHIDKNTLNDVNNYIVTNFGSPMYDNLIIGNTLYHPNETINKYSRYFVNTKEEFLSVVAKLLGKEYPSKEQIIDTKYPYIKCTQQLYNKIKDILQVVGYEERNMDAITFDFVHNPYLVVDYLDVFGDISNIKDITKPTNNRYECSNIREFLTKVCELKGYIVSYINNTNDDNLENHYFGYCANEVNKTIGIYENLEYVPLTSIIMEENNKKKLKKKKENYVVSYDSTIDESSTVVTTMSAKGNDFDKDKKDMEKINIIEKLKYCKKGTKLYHLMFGEVEFDGIDNNDILVITTNQDNEKGRYYVNSFGLYDINYPNGECLLFPSKDNRDWSSFQVLEEGHRVMVSDNGLHWSLRKYYKNEAVYRFDDTDINIDNASVWKYIVPIEEFDFTAEDITINKEKSII